MDDKRDELFDFIRLWKTHNLWCKFNIFCGIALRSKLFMQRVQLFTCRHNSGTVYWASTRSHEISQPPQRNQEKMRCLRKRKALTFKTSPLFICENHLWIIMKPTCISSLGFYLFTDPAKKVSLELNWHFHQFLSDLCLDDGQLPIQA